MNVLVQFPVNVLYNRSGDALKISSTGQAKFLDCISHLIFLRARDVRRPHGTREE